MARSPDLALAKQLAKVRGEAGLSQDELGRRLGLGRTQISRVESGRRSTSVEVVRAWFEACGYALETVSPGDPRRAAALAEALANLDEHEIDDVIAVVRGWRRLPGHLRQALVGMASEIA